MNKTAIQQLAEFVCNTPRERHPTASIERAGFALLDTLGCMLLGAESEVARVSRQAVAGWGEGNASIIGSGIRLPAPWAALSNGAAAHALDIDDYTFIANDHPSAVMLPALLAACSGRERDISGSDLIDAYLIGLEVIFTLGEAVNMGHYKLGWHTTSTIDSLGATAAICRLDGLDCAQTVAALSLTTSLGSGYVSQFGTSGKPLHAGFAAKAGLLAASLGAAGATGYIGALDGPVSFASLLVPQGEADFDSALGKMGEPWGIEEHGLGAKVYPSCGYAHRAVDAALAARAELGLDDINQIESVAASLPDFHLAVLPYGVPRDRTEALFSAPFCVATALATGGNRIEDFSEQAISREEILQLTERVKVSGRKTRRPELNFDPEDPDIVEVRLVDGRSARCEVPIYTGAPGRDLDRDDFVAKFADCHRHFLDAGGDAGLAVDAMIEAALGIADAPDLVALFEAFCATAE